MPNDEQYKEAVQAQKLEYKDLLVQISGAQDRIKKIKAEEDALAESLALEQEATAAQIKTLKADIARTENEKHVVGEAFNALIKEKARVESIIEKLGNKERELARCNQEIETAKLAIASLTVSKESLFKEKADAEQATELVRVQLQAISAEYEEKCAMAFKVAEREAAVTKRENYIKDKYAKSGVPY